MKPTHPTPPPSHTEPPRRPWWGGTLGLILLVWLALGICALLWELWTPRELNGLVIYLSAGLIGLAFTAAAIYDHFWRRIDRNR